MKNMLRSSKPTTASPIPNLPTKFSTLFPTQIPTAMLSYSHLSTSHPGVGLSSDAFVLLPFLLRSTTHPIPPVHARALKSGCTSDRYVRKTILHCYAKRGPISYARKVFDEMTHRTTLDCNVMISGYWSRGNEAAASQMFDTMPERNAVSWTAMVSGYSKLGHLEKARAFFEAMPERTVVSWNAMLSGYSQNGSTEEALALFARMIDSGVQPNEKTCVTVASACSAKGDLKLAEALFGSIEKSKVQMNCFVKTSLVDMYSKCGDLRKARRVFDEMGERNVVSWNVMISAYARVGDLDSAREIFDGMPERNAISWNSMISGLVQNAQWVEAIDLFRDMVRVKGVDPDEVTMVSLISACGHLGALETGRWVLKFLDRCSINLSISGYNALVFMYSRCGRLDLARRVFDGISKRNVFSYNSLVNGLAVHGHASEAIGLMRRMEEEGIKPDRVTYISILTACSHSGLLDEGRRIFESIEKPSVDHYACMIDLLGRDGRLDEMKEMIDGMPMEPHSGIYGSLLHASRVHRRVDLGEFAAGNLFVMEPENSGNYVLLANMYASAGRWDDAAKIRSMMRQRHVSKASGKSWIELDGRIIRFVAGDRRHCEMDKIYRSLESLISRMKAMGYVADGNCVLRDVEEEEKEEIVGFHSEKLAVAFALGATEAGSVIRVVKNLRICEDCHNFMKMASKLEGREILVRDSNRFHSFKGGKCSCNDYW